MIKIILWVLISGLNLHAATGETGTTAATFIKLGTGSRSVAMGEAYTALSDDSEGLSYNPAGIALAGSSVELTHNEWFQGAMSEHLAGILSLGDFGSLGVNLNYLFIPVEPITQRIANTSDPAQNFSQIGSFSPFDTYATISYAYSFSKKFNLGASLKVSGQNIDEKTGMGFGADMGVIYKTQMDGLVLGMSVQNFGLPVTIVQDQFSLPMIIRLGGSYTTPAKDMIVSAEFDQPNDNQHVIAIGLEYNVGNILYPRFGYRIDGIFNPWSAGLGFQMGKARIDLATIPYGELGQTYRASISYDFFDLKSAKEAPEQVASVLSRSVLLESPRNAMLLTDKDTFVDIKPMITPADQVKAWAFYIYDKGPKPSVIRKIAGTGAVPADLVWDARADSGVRSAAGGYPAILAVEFADGKVVYSNYVKLSLSNISQYDMK